MLCLFLGGCGLQPQLTCKAGNGWKEGGNGKALSRRALFPSFTALGKEASNIRGRKCYVLRLVIAGLPNNDVRLAQKVRVTPAPHSPKVPYTASVGLT